LCMHLAEGAPISDATRTATVAAGLSVTVSGAREGMPTKKAIAHAMATYID
jgi:sugar/nucleoside kinase (ribokinase family)